MKRILLGVALLLATPAHAQEDTRPAMWQSLRAGMTREEVEAIYKVSMYGDIHAMVDGKRYDLKATFKRKAKEEPERLVELELDGNGAEKADAVEAQLREKYGDPSSVESAEYHPRFTRVTETHTLLTWRLPGVVMVMDRQTGGDLYDLRWLDTEGSAIPL